MGYSFLMLRMVVYIWSCKIDIFRYICHDQHLSKFPNIPNIIQILILNHFLLLSTYSSHIHHSRGSSRRRFHFHGCLGINWPDSRNKNRPQQKNGLYLQKSRKSYVSYIYYYYSCILGNRI